MKKILLATALTVVATSLALAQGTKNVEVTIDGVAGFQDTPLQPNGKWHVHDPARPQPVAVTPGASFSQLAPPPADATVLFDGKDVTEWTDKSGNPAPWTVVDGAMVSAKSDIVSKKQFGDVQLHLEFREPTPGRGEGQGRGNSGVYFMDKYEIQVLDCYQNKTYADGSTGGIYGQHPPLANACRPAGEWQTYDIIWKAPRFNKDSILVSPAYLTVLQNGVLIQNHVEVMGQTFWIGSPVYEPHGASPIRLQAHPDQSEPISFRNIWIRTL